MYLRIEIKKLVVSKKQLRKNTENRNYETYHYKDGYCCLSVTQRTKCVDGKKENKSCNTHPLF
ncbi:CLUMA_CG005476, isoform A [Clunio marinus]|uniref:CLUMA_CG005476, isoform A n=1 Tax=Clunio marinus TaxID=568069 RepID=A0A1J1HUV8_9DIPT|nr:CLUMA_CG005476, isoform A [Clunio marinus]